MAKRSNVGRVKISELNSFPEKYDCKGVKIKGSISKIIRVESNPRTFILDDGTGTVLVEYNHIFSTSVDGSKEGDEVIVEGTFYVTESRNYVNGYPTWYRVYGVFWVLPGFEAVFAIVGLLAVAYLLRRRT